MGYKNELDIVFDLIDNLKILDWLDIEINTIVSDTKPSLFNRHKYLFCKLDMKEYLYTMSEKLDKLSLNETINFAYEFYDNYIYNYRKLFSRYRNNSDITIKDLSESKKVISLVSNTNIIYITKEITKIPNPAKGNIALSMIYGNNDSSLIMYKIESLINEHDVINSFTLVENEDLSKYDNNTITYLDIINSEIKKLIYNEFKGTLENIIEFYTGINYLENVVKYNGFWIRKYKSQ